MNFTPDEKHYIAYFARVEKLLYRLGFYAAWLTPIFAFGAYGLLDQDFVALGMAFFALFSFMLWLITAASRSRRMISSICSKLAESHLSQP
jgi:hypothetical protein